MHPAELRFLLFAGVRLELNAPSAGAFAGLIIPSVVSLPP